MATAVAKLLIYWIAGIGIGGPIQKSFAKELIIKCVATVARKRARARTFKNWPKYATECPWVEKRVYVLDISEFSAISWNIDVENGNVSGMNKREEKKSETTFRHLS